MSAASKIVPTESCIVDQKREADPTSQGEGRWHRGS